MNNFLSTAINHHRRDNDHIALFFILEISLVISNKMNSKINKSSVDEYLR